MLPSRVQTQSDVPSSINQYISIHQTVFTRDMNRPFHRVNIYPFSTRPIEKKSKKIVTKKFK